MFYIACTRFTPNTYKENHDYRASNLETVIYGAALKIRKIYPYGSLIFVAEMNNESNRIEGMGLIKNTLVSDRRHKIYENNEYNRYIYRGQYWLSRNQLDNFDREITEILDNILFKKKSHLKCRTGITILTEKIFTHWEYKLCELKNKIKQLFLYYFKRDLSEESGQEEEIFEIIPKKKELNSQS